MVARAYLRRLPRDWVVVGEGVGVLGMSVNWVFAAAIGRLRLRPYRARNHWGVVHRGVVHRGGPLHRGYTPAYHMTGLRP